MFPLSKGRCPLNPYLISGIFFYTIYINGEKGMITKMFLCYDGQKKISASLILNQTPSNPGVVNVF